MSKLPFGFEKPEDSPGFLLWQTTLLWQRLLKKMLDDFEISHAQFVILATLLWFEAHEYDPTQASIASWTKLDKMTVSKSLKKLVTLQLVTRIEHENDPRAKSVSLANKGKKLIRKLIPLVEHQDEVFFSKLNQEEQTLLIKLLNKLAKDV